MWEIIDSTGDGTGNNFIGAEDITVDGSGNVYISGQDTDNAFKIESTITIIKDTVPDSGQDFAFTTTGGLTPTSFSLDDDTDGTLADTRTFSTLTAGSYTVTETAVAGFTTTLSCVDPDGGTTTSGTTATIDLDTAETVTCTFTNTATGTIEIIKDTVPDAAPDFSFTDNIATPNTFMLDDDTDGTLPTMQTFTNVPIGTFTVTEAAVAGYNTTVACVDPDNGSTPAGTNVATIDVDAGETITCTFTNTQLGMITIIKDTVPDAAQDFSFTDNIAAPNAFTLDDDADGTLSNTQTFTNVAPGTFTVTEAAVAGYTTTVACVDPDGGSTTAGTNVATIDLDPGETVTCTFTNSGDDDGDGIANPIDGTVNGTFTDQSAVFSNDFTTQHLGGTTFGSIRTRADLQVLAQAPLPATGVRLRAAGGGVGTAVVQLCAETLPVLLTNGDAGEFVCGSLQIQVTMGPIEIVLSGGSIVMIPTGATATVTDDPATPGVFSVVNAPGSPAIEILLNADASTTVQVPAGATAVVTEDHATPGEFTVVNGAGSTAPITVNTPSGPVVVPPGGNTVVVVPTPIPTLPQWGMILLTLSSLTLATWQLAGQRVVVGATEAAPPAAESQWLRSLLLGQGLATLSLVLYAVLVGPLVPHDGLGAFLAGLLLGVMVEGYRRSR